MANFSFNDLPVIRHSRSRFDLSHSVKTSANVGTLYPFEVQEVYPGDTFKVQTAVVSRLSSQFIRPVMDNLFLDVYYFFVPSRILYDKFVNVFGENTESAWAQTQEYEVPSTADGGIVPERSVGDYLGLPISVPLEGVSVLPFRAFAKVYDDWFRDQNNVSPMHIQTGERVSSEAYNSQPWSPSNYFGQCPKVSKLADYFTSALPAPQKGSAVPVSASGFLPVVARNQPVPGIGSGSPAMDLIFTNGGVPTSSLLCVGGSAANGGLPVYPASGTVTIPGSAQSLVPSNLWADASGAILGDVNDLRFAFQYQKMLERDARSGSRFVEYINAAFGVSAGDYRLQRSEFLGGRRTPISIHQVVSTTGAEEQTLGFQGAYSWTNGRSRFTKSFTEHGIVLGVFCIRYTHSYQQGVEKFWSRKGRSDFYDPVFAHIGEQPIYRREIFANSSGTPGAVFGYQEAWADLRYRPNRVSGQMRSAASASLDVWHFADDYTNAPTLNEQFIQETPVYVDRSIAVQSELYDQFILDFYVQNIAYRVMPTYSVPSLIDHG